MTQTETTQLLALSPLDGRYANAATPLRNHLSEFALIRERFVVECRWLQALLQLQEINIEEGHKTEALETLGAWERDFGVHQAARVKDIEKTTNHDVKAVEYLLGEMIDDSGLKGLLGVRQLVHFGCTSEDINNVAYARMLKNVRTEVLLPTINQIVESLALHARRFADSPMLSRTHGQTATPTTLGKEFANFRARLRRHRDALEVVRISAKMNGAVGNFNAHYVAWPDVDWPAFSKNVLEGMGLDYNPCTIQIEPHDWVAEYLHVLIRINTVLIDFSRDIWGYISLGYFSQKTVAGEVGSSTMPHKVNPIDFENAEGNFGVSNSVASHMAEKLLVSRWQRDLTDSTVLRNLGVVIGHSFIAMQSLLKGIGKLEVNKLAMDRDLNESWEVLTEPIQTVLRKHGVPGAYEKLKAFSRGKSIGSNSIKEFLTDLPLPSADKKRLEAISPCSYLGLAAKLALDEANQR